jgi:death on curing protein
MNRDWLWVQQGALELLHDESLAEHGGAPGLRDGGLLTSALARAPNLAHYGSPTVFELAACYGVALAKNHAFIDGNKRAAFLAVGLFLALNGQRLTATQADATLTIFGVAAGSGGEADLADWLQRHCVPR